MQDLWTNAIFWRGFERVAIVGCCAMSMYFGYRLFVYGIKEGMSKFAAESKWMKITFSGSGPGLIFMAFGGIVLIIALIKGGATTGDQSVSGPHKNQAHATAESGGNARADNEPNPPIRGQKLENIP